MSSPVKWGIAPRGVFTGRGPLRNGVEASKESQPFVQCLGHDPGRPPDAPELESQKRPYSTARGLYYVVDVGCAGLEAFFL